MKVVFSERYTPGKHYRWIERNTEVFELKWKGSETVKQFHQDWSTRQSVHISVLFNEQSHEDGTYHNLHVSSSVP